MILYATSKKISNFLKIIIDFPSTSTYIQNKKSICRGIFIVNINMDNMIPHGVRKIINFYFLINIIDFLSIFYNRLETF